jgi:hypothetical protein
MRWLSIAILLMAVFAFSPPKSAEADDFSFSIGFHDELSPYGSWINYSSYGNVWRPYGYSNFHPYSDGYWGYTNYGPTWHGNEPYASYVYHYGHWIFTPNYGWVWIPGTSWHGGRVDWSYGGGYIGWRPQFPGGYNYGYGNDYNFWVVIDSDRFGYGNYRPYRLGRDRVRDLFARRVFRQRYDTFRRADLERIVRRPVRVLNVRERTARIGDRRTRLLVTPDEEVRIRKNVTQVRGRRDNDRRTVERETVMKRKFDDIRTKSSKEVRRSDDDRRTEVRRSEVRRPDSRERERIEKSKPSRKVFTNREKEVQKKSKTVVKPSSRKSDRDNDRLSRTSSTSRKTQVERAVRSSRKPATIERSSHTVRKPAKVERSTRTVRKSEVRSSRAPSRTKAEVSKKTTKKESTRKQKPSRRKN